MNLFKAAVTGVKALFGMPDSKGADLISDSVRGVGKWIDEQQFTEEESKVHKMELFAKYSTFLENTVAENSERSITRRFIALWVIRVEMGLLILSVLLFKIDPEWSEYLYKVATNDPLNYLVLGVGAFFFGAHLIRAAK